MIEDFLVTAIARRVIDVSVQSVIASPMGGEESKASNGSVPIIESQLCTAYSRHMMNQYFSPSLSSWQFPIGSIQVCLFGGGQSQTVEFATRTPVSTL